MIDGEKAFQAPISLGVCEGKGPTRDTNKQLVKPRREKETVGVDEPLLT